MLFYRQQTWFFCLITTLFVGPYLLLHGTNIVTHTYQFAAMQFFAGLSPYADPQGQGDLFKYSPFFCILYYPISLLYKNVEAFVWGLLNLAFYWYGVTRWAKLEKASSKWLWFAFLACSMEIDGSLRYQQVNASLIGLTLIGIALYRDQRFFSAGFLLAIATNIKVLPILFFLSLMVPWNRRYMLGAVSGLLIAFVTPVFFVGWNATWTLHREWFYVLLKDVNGAGLLDLATILGRYGIENAKIYFSVPLGIVTALLLLVARLFPHYFSWNAFISLGVFSLLLLSPRTESPTFVLAGPCYVLLMMDALKWEPPTKTSFLLSLVMGISLVTLSMNDIWPRSILDVGSLRYANKTFGILVLWFATVSVFCHELMVKLPQRKKIEV